MAWIHTRSERTSHVYQGARAFSCPTRQPARRATSKIMMFKVLATLALCMSAVIAAPLAPRDNDEEYMLVTKVITQLVHKGNGGHGGQTKTVTKTKTKTHYETVTVGCSPTQTYPTLTFPTESPTLTPTATLTTTIPTDTVTFTLTSNTLTTATSATSFTTITLSDTLTTTTSGIATLPDATSSGTSTATSSTIHIHHVQHRTMRTQDFLFPVPAAAFQAFSHTAQMNGIA
ncbi:hypothetical protein FRC10_011819 [Ceratobasidium sp. 414]|nr:hypothetical protein FRC10_011819 [Ceratobasidium sp. 414]